MESTPSSTATLSSVKFLTFEVNNIRYAINILKVKEIIGELPITPIENAPEFAKGIINLRGNMIPVIDVRLKLHIEEPFQAKFPCVIIVETQGPDFMPVLTGLEIDHVCNVSQISPQDIQPLNIPGDNIDKDYILGVAHLDEAETIVLEIDKFLECEDTHALRELHRHA